MDTKLQEVKPQKIDISDWFSDTIWQNFEKERIARNIVVIHRKDNTWQSFTWEEYQEKCNHKVSSGEKQILDAFVKGGFLSLTESKYSITDTFLEALEKYFK